MDNMTIAILASLVAFFVTTMAFPIVLRFAKRHNIVDNPNARKLQRIPVPVMGGVAVYCGIIAGGAVTMVFWPSPFILWGSVAMTIMMVIGVWDDMKDIRAMLRFLIEIALVIGLIEITDVYIDNFHGLWGVYELPDGIAKPLSVIAGVGIINAINLIDGVDGYSSGYGIMACGCFAIISMVVWRPAVVCLALVVMSSILPFFLHNVFGIRSKMFIGDGGTLMLGMLMTLLVFLTLSGNSAYAKLEEQNVGLLAFTLAVMCVPVFDTVRVMTMRMIRGKSPFHPDKTHLHHLFIDMGFSHIGAAASIVLMNASVVLIWWLLWRLGASIDIQTYAVLLMGVLVTFAFYKFMKVQQNGGVLDEDGYPQGTWVWHLFCKIGKKSHFEKGKAWVVIRSIVDSKILSIGSEGILGKVAG